MTIFNCGRSLFGPIARSALTTACLAGLTVALLPAAYGQSTYPNRPIRLISPYSPGGNADLTARYLAKKLNEGFGVPVTVDNKPGASSIIGTELLARSAPDGYTIMLVGVGGTTHTVNPSLIAKLPYDSIRDFTPVSMFSRVPMVLVVTSSFPARSLGELIAMAKARPETINAASGGEGTASDLSVRLFMSISQTRFTVVNYKGNAPALTDTIAGQTQVLFDTMSTALQQIKSQRVRPLAVTTTQRSPFLPDVPTVAESGFPGFEIAVYLGVLAPARTPAEVVNKLNAEMAKVTRDPASREYFAEQAVELISSTPEQLLAFMKTDIARWEKVTREAGIRAK